MLCVLFLLEAPRIFLFLLLSKRNRKGIDRPLMYWDKVVITAIINRGWLVNSSCLSTRANTGVPSLTSWVEARDRWARSVELSSWNVRNFNCIAISFCTSVEPLINGIGYFTENVSFSWSIAIQKAAVRANVARSISKRFKFRDTKKGLQTDINNISCNIPVNTR